MARKPYPKDDTMTREELILGAAARTGDKPAGEPAEHLTENQILYSKREEWMNRITHCVGGGLAIIAAVFLIVKAAMLGYNGRGITAVCLYSFALILMFTISTLYHWMTVGKRRRAVFRRLDHCSIPLLIAGTYAPYMLIEVYRTQPVWAIVLCSTVLLMAVLTITFNAINVNKFRVFGMIAYVVMGWACMMRIDIIFGNLPAFICLLSGGLLYTAGILLYATKKVRYNHAIFHYFVIFGAIAHYLGIVLFIVV